MQNTEAVDLPAWSQLVSGVGSFLAGADTPTVLIIVLLTYLIHVTVWRRLHLWPEAIAWVPIILAFVLTPIMSFSEESGWGGKYLWQFSFRNGAVSFFAWRLAVPQLKKRWPALFEEGAESESEKP